MTFRQDEVSQHLMVQRIMGATTAESSDRLFDANVEPNSGEFEPSLWNQRMDIENWRLETGARNSWDASQNR
jgi:hypothetical protein